MSFNEYGEIIGLEHPDTSQPNPSKNTINESGEIVRPDNLGEKDTHEKTSAIGKDGRFIRDMTGESSMSDLGDAEGRDRRVDGLFHIEPLTHEGHDEAFRRELANDDPIA
jgi:hypothetical protein